MNTRETEIWSSAPTRKQGSALMETGFPQGTCLPKRNKGTKAPGPETQHKYLHPGHNESSQKGSIEAWGHWEEEAWAKSGGQTPAQEGGVQGGGWRQGCPSWPHLEKYCWMQSKLPWGLSRPMLER